LLLSASSPIVSTLQWSPPRARRTPPKSLPGGFNHPFPLRRLHESTVEHSRFIRGVARWPNCALPCHPAAPPPLPTRRPCPVKATPRRLLDPAVAPAQRSSGTESKVDKPLASRQRPLLSRGRPLAVPCKTRLVPRAVTPIGFPRGPPKAGGPVHGRCARSGGRIPPLLRPIRQITSIELNLVFAFCPFL
jgi:hypothetical protein